MKDRTGDDRALRSIASFLLSVRRAALALIGRLNGRDRRIFDLIEDSSLFDAEWYLRAYPDVAEARVNPLQHYMNVGWHEGRDPGPEFSTSSYLKANRDVAQAGMNPLLHFMEFGHQEGRGPSAHRPVRKPFKPSFADFGAAAPCASFPIADEEPIRWRRGYQLPATAERFSAGACVVGLVPDEIMRADLEASFSRLKQLSGYDRIAAGAEEAQLPRSADRLLDAWYLTTEQLRTRWRSEDFPVIVRAFQHDPLRDGMLCLVGEGLAASPIDTVDLDLSSPYFPVLLIFSTPDGTVRGVEILAFPSLCRGGVHYSELLYSAVVANHADEVDPLGAGEALALRLLGLNGAVRPAVGRIELEIEGGDGRGHMFQPDFQLWLKQVLNISVAPIGPTSSRAFEFLAEAGAVPPSTDSREGGAVLRIGSDMVPTIGVLTEAKEPEDVRTVEVVIPFIVAGPDASQPVVAIEFPRLEPAKVDMPGLQGEARSPRLLQGPEAALGGHFPPAAIAFPADRDMNDATLFLPIAAVGSAKETRSPITWIVETRGWADGGLAQAVIAISLQSGGSDDCLFFIGDADPLAEAIARERMTGGVNRFEEARAAIAAAPTEVVAYAAAGVLLHDARTASVLASLLDDEWVATASCALVAVDQSRSGWHARIADGGSFAAPSGTTLRRAEHNAATAFLWGSNYPVTAPGGHLWLARKPSLAEWMEGSPGPLSKGLHICSSAVTASYVGEEVPLQAPAYIPAGKDERATRVRALFG
jgi:hypothetical protein